MQRKQRPTNDLSFLAKDQDQTGEDLLLDHRRPDRTIGYYERAGAIFFAYSEQHSEGNKSWRYESFGPIPQETCSQSIEAIQLYAKAEVEKDISEQRERHAKFDRFRTNPNVPITFEYQGLILSGRVVSAKNPLVVRLEQPYQGESLIHYGFASAMARHYILAGGDEPRLSDDALEKAKRMLVEIYRRERYKEENKDTISLINKLNNR